MKILFIIFLFFAAAAHAESVWHGIGEDLISPVTTEAKPYFLSGVGVTGVLLIFEDGVSDPITKKTAQTKPLGKTSNFGNTMGQLVPNAIYAGGMFAYGYYGSSQLGYDRAKLMLFATLYSGIVTDVIKPIARERRPDHTDQQSFPSGHATSAFAFASVVGAVHGWAWGIPAYALAAFVGYSRMNDNKHYLHDVVAGAAIGTGYGLGLYYRMRQRGDLDAPGTTAREKVHFENIFVGPNSEGGDSLNLIASY